MTEKFHTINMKELGKESPDAGMGPDVIQVPTKGFSGYPMESWSEQTGRRVFHEGGWYTHKGTEDGMDILDKIPAAVLKAEHDEAEAEEAKRVQEKGHDCSDFTAHGLYARDNGSMNDYYFCTICDEVLQVG